MRFLLINPFYPISETPSPPLGLAFLAGALERAGVEVRVLDLVVFPYSKAMLESVLNEFSPHLVGATAVTMTIDHALSVLEDVKSLTPDVLTVMGGPHVSFCAEETLQICQALDFVIPGEGDDTIVELAGETAGDRNWSGIQGLVYREGSEIRRNGVRAPGLPVDTLPMPARHLLPLGRYRALRMPISMTTSRGCPFQCIFCVGRKMVGPRVRRRNPQSVVDELAYLAGLDFHQVNIADDLFTANRTHCLSVCDEIIRRGLQVKWSAFARVDTVTREILSRMKEAGCTAVSFGVESANAGILKTIRKGITLEQVVTAISLCVDVGLSPHVSFILGLPGETPATLEETILFGKRIKDMGALHGFHLLTPFPGTEVREQSERYGVTILTNDWRRYHANRAIAETATVDQMTLDDVVIEWEQKFDEWLGDIKSRMGTGGATEEEARMLTGLEHTVLIYDLMMGRIIEEQGSWRNNGRPPSQADPLDTLAKRVARVSSYSREEVAQILGRAVDKKSLTCHEEPHQVRWEWNEFL